MQPTSAVSSSQDSLWRASAQTIMVRPSRAAACRSLTRRTVDREGALAPGQEDVEGLLADETLVHEHARDLGLEEAFEVAGVGA